MARHQHWTYRLCRYIKLILLYTTGSPYMDPKSRRAKHVLEKLDAGPLELREYREVWGQSWKTMLIGALLALFLDVKYLLVITLTLTSADHKEPERNIKLIATGDGSFRFRFNCLASNCSRPLSGLKMAGLGQDFKRVPHMWWCNPELAATGQFSPWDLLDTQTLLNQAALLTFITMLGIIYPTFQALFASPNEALMFMLAPKLTTQLVCDKLLELRQDLSLSYLNFRSALLKLRGERLRGHPSTSGLRSRRQTAGQQLRSCQLSGPSAAFGLNQLGPYARDCLPAVRLAHWWRPRAALTMSSTFLALTLMTLTVEAAFILVTLVVIDRHRLLMGAYAREAASQSCSIWIDRTGELVDLNRPALSYSLYNVVEYGLFFAAIPLGLASILSLFYLIVIELNFWVRELELKLAIAIELLRLQNSLHGPGGRPTTTTTKSAELSPSFSMGTIRDLIIRSSRANLVGFIYFHLNNKSPRSPTETGLAHQMYALKLMREHQPGSHVDCIEKLYLSFRLFMDLVEQYGRIVAPLLFFAHGLTYSFAAIGVYYTLNIRDLTFEALLLAFGFMLAVSIFILIGATVHSNAARLSPLVWSLMAQISQTNDPRLEHLLLLWSKMQTSISYEGGIYLKALGRRFDYFNIVQLTIGTSTIMILAMKN